MRLILIRHGQTSDNEQKLYAGIKDAPLSERGRKQAESLTPLMKDKGVSVVYRSDLARARQTAKIAFPFFNATEDLNFREINFGLFEGLRHEELMDRFPVEYQAWIDNPCEVTPPQGESLMDLQNRVLSRLKQIIAEHADDTVAIVSHGGPIKIILCDVLNQGFEDFWNISQGWGRFSIIDYSTNHPPQVISLNDG